MWSVKLSWLAVITPRVRPSRLCGDNHWRSKGNAYALLYGRSIDDSQSQEDWQETCFPTWQWFQTHCKNHTRTFKEEKVIVWPNQCCPELNPIEQLSYSFKAEGQNISLQICARLISSMVRRLESVIKNKCWHTKYYLVILTEACWRHDFLCGVEWWGARWMPHCPIQLQHMQSLFPICLDVISILFRFVILSLCHRFSNSVSWELNLQSCFSSSQDYHWQWRSFLTSGFTAVYFLVYAIHYFFSKLQITGLASTILYFGYTMIMALIFFLFTGRSIKEKWMMTVDVFFPLTVIDC